VTLSSGDRLGSYEIVALLGAGGMGVVYRATDSKLGRDVAIKVLSETFARDPERLARFEREARVLASLNHTNIAAIYGFEQAGGTPFLVLEYVPGEILRGPAPLDETVAIARQIAGALEAAHEKGFMHRDLKPANVKLTPEGKVKVLDFGLAKALAGEPAAGDPQQSPTVSLAATRAGTLLGTAAYMSPEQARGRPADKRADIWAFGCVLYELLTGRQAFGGASISDTLAAVLRAEPDWGALPAGTPPELRRLLRRCLEKDLNARLRDIGDARFELQESLAGIATPPAPGEGRRRAVLWAAGGVLAGALAAGVAVWTLKPATSTAPRTRTAVTLPPGQALETAWGPAVALSPDGARLVYLGFGRSGATMQLYLRPMDQFEAKPIAGAEDAYSPFFSSDGQWIGFFAGDKLKKVALAGGPATILAEAPNGLGGSWGPDDTIVFAPDGWVQGLWRVPAAGGKAEPITKPDPKKGESSHSSPQHLPGGEVVLFTTRKGPSPENAVIEALTLKTGERRVLIQGGSNVSYLPSGRLVYARGGALLAAPFNLARLAVTGPSLPVLEGVLSSSGGAHFSVSAGGTLVYVPASSVHAERSLVSVDRNGVTRPLTAVRRPYEDMSLSPDGRRLALTIEGPTWNVWILDLARGTLTPLTLEHDNRDPMWTRDSKRVLYASFRNGRYGLYWKPADSSGPEELLTSGEYPIFPGTWSPDGQVLAFNMHRPETQEDILLLSLDGQRQPRPFVNTKFNEAMATFSPDGRSMAYDSTESGRPEVYVHAYPGPGARVQVSTEGGRRPVWASNGRELYYRNGDKMMAVAIETKPSFKAASPRVLFEGRYWSAGHDYDVSPAGDRFYLIQEGPAPTEIRVVMNWGR